MTRTPKRAGRSVAEPAERCGVTSRRKKNPVAAIIDAAAPAPQPLAEQDLSAIREPPAPPPESDISDKLKDCAGLDHSDTDNGVRLRIYFGHDLLVMEQSGVIGGDFGYWTGTHWDLDGGAAGAERIAQRIGDLIQAEADFIEATPQEARAIDDGKAAASELKHLEAAGELDTEQKQRLEDIINAGKAARAAFNKRKIARRKFGVTSKNGGRIENMLKRAAPHMRLPPDKFNADPMLVATLTHTLRFMVVEEPDPECPDPDLKRMRRVAKVVATPGHRREDLITALVPVPYDPEFKGDKWKRFMERFQPDPETRRSVQQYAGLGLLGMPIQRLMFHVGTGANGKSVFLETLTRVLGPSFAVGLPAESITGMGDRGAGSASPDLARLFGKRMVRVLELKPGAPLQVEVIKRLTGGEKIPVRTLFKGYFEFQPKAKPHMSGNDFPTFDGSDGGMRRRLIIIEWPVTIPESEQRDLEDVVTDFLTEAPAIMNWLIEGALDYLQNGLIIAPKALADTREYFEEMDPVGQFVRACVEAAPGENVQARPMYEAYVAWSTANARKPVFEQKFGRVMKKNPAIKRDETGRVRLYRDVRLRDVPAIVERADDHRGGASADQLTAEHEAFR